MNRANTLRCIAVATTLGLTCSVAIAQQPAPDAAQLYRKAFSEINRSLRLDTGEPLDYPRVAAPSLAAFRQAPWPELLEKTAVARTLFAQAARLERCWFDKRPQRSARADEVRERFSDFRTMQTFVVAHAYSVVSTRPDASLEDAEALFGAARHLEQQGGLFDALFAIQLADGGRLICEVLLDAHGARAPRPAVLQRALATIQARREGRSNLNRLADHAVADARGLLSLMGAPDQENATSIQAAKARAIEMIEELVLPLRGANAGDVERVRDATDQLVANLKAKFAGKPASEVVATGAGEALAAVLATLVAPNSAGLLAAWAEHGQQLRRVESALRARVGAADASKRREENR